MGLGLANSAVAQTCTGLCTQQVTGPNGVTTTITGTVYAPNGIDPLSSVLVYIPNAPVAAFTPGVSCSALGEQPSGLPLVGTVTAVDGTFTLANGYRRPRLSWRSVPIPDSQLYERVGRNVRTKHRSMTAWQKCLCTRKIASL
jgi:hypothetical protein